MKALLCEAFGPPESLTFRDVDDPVPGPGEAVIDVHSAGVNFPDTLIIEGKYQFRPDFPFSPGSEVAGVVSALGEGVDSCKVGDRVISMTGHGAFAEKVKVDAGRIMPMPDTMDYDTAAGFPMIYGTSWYALKQRAQLQAGETLLVLGAAGGVGYAAVELGKAVGARVIAAASTAEKLEVARRAGADEVINYSEESMKERVKELTGGQGADVIYDPVGGELGEECLRCIGWEGRLLVIGFTAGIPRPPTNLVLLKGCQVVGVFWGSWTARDPAGSAENFRELFEMHAQGKLKPLVSKKFPLEQGADAIRWLGERRAQGKVIVNPQ